MPFDRHNGDEQIDGEYSYNESKPNPRPFPERAWFPSGTLRSFSLVGVRKHNVSFVRSQPMIGWNQPATLELLWNLDSNPDVPWNLEQLFNLSNFGIVVLSSVISLLSSLPTRIKVISPRNIPLQV